ncbi:hypothetical protein D3C72_1701990 [compost metagenome]
MTVMPSISRMRRKVSSNDTRSRSSSSAMKSQRPLVLCSALTCGKPRNCSATRSAILPWTSIITTARTPEAGISCPVRMVKAAIVPLATSLSMRAATVARDTPVRAERVETGRRAFWRKALISA